MHLSFLSTMMHLSFLSTMVVRISFPDLGQDLNGTESGIGRFRIVRFQGHGKVVLNLGTSSPVRLVGTGQTPKVPQECSWGCSPKSGCSGECSQKCFSCCSPSYGHRCRHPREHSLKHPDFGEHSCKHSREHFWGLPTIPGGLPAQEVIYLKH